MNNKLKLLVTDIDGTLADADGTISDTDLEALQRVHRDGVMISLCTGRPAGGCWSFLDRIMMQGLHIFFDGALITDSTLSREIYSKTILVETVVSICERSLPETVNLELFSRDRFFVNRQHPLSDVHAGLMDFTPEVADLNEIAGSMPMILACIAAPLSEEQHILSLFQDLEDEINICPTKHPAHPDISLINITAQGIHKGTAVSALMKHLGLQPKEVIALGDGVNDIPLLVSAGTAVAMKNAPGSVKAIADYVTEDVQHSGLAQAIDHFFPID